MTYKEMRIAQIDMDSILKSYLEEYHSITIDADKHGVKVRVWRSEQGNRKPVAFAYRKELSDAMKDIEKELKDEKLAV